MNDDIILNIQPILKGEIVYAPKYNKQIIDEYKNNPCIEALPDIFEDEFIVNKLANYPQINKHREIENENIKYHMLENIKNYYQPLSKHLQIEHKLSCSIRRSYIARNPASKEYLQRIRLILEVMEEKNQDKKTIDFDVCKNLINKFTIIPESTRASGDCFSIIGVSGMGKSSAIEKLLLMYPQVIIHRKYKGKPLTRTQITWLKLDCPFDGSIKTLCKMFFKALDDILLTTKYYSSYASYRNSTATMMIHMTHLASLHSIGVLIIDEMQHLINNKNTESEILNFLVTLRNTIGISIIQIGTPKLNSVLSKGLRELRRAEESGSIFLDRMNEDDEEWNFFIENLWEEQILKNYTPIDENLKKAMYYESQGIIAIARTLFILIQIEAIFNNTEKITINLIHDVAKKDLRLTKKAVEAIRNGKFDEIENYEDIFIEFDSIIQDKIKDAEHRKRVRELSSKYKESIIQNNKHFKETLINEVISMGLFVYVDYDKLEKIVETIVKGDPKKLNTPLIKQQVVMAAMEEENRISENKNKTINLTSKNISYDIKDLRNLFDKSQKKKIHIYDVLKTNRYIKDPLEELY
jgi:hypothetical protein